MGFIHDSHGRVTIETRSESLIVHADYGYDETGNEWSDRDGKFGEHWRTMGHPDTPGTGGFGTSLGIEGRITHTKRRKKK